MNNQSAEQGWTPLDVVGARPWRSVAFTTYSLSLSFFESVVLDRLVRGGAREALILADVEGVRAGLSEQGARRVGREYTLEPIANAHGAFHPKLSVLIGEDDAHLVVGSGNLTFGGWGANLEMAEHLHTSFASSAFNDAADFFESAASAPRLRHGAAARMAALSDVLRMRARGVPDDGAVRLIHNIEQPLKAQVVALAGELGGATRLCFASPFWDQGAAIDHLCRDLGLSEVHVHVAPGGPVIGKAGYTWPLKPDVAIVPIALDVLNDTRPMHAKAFEVLCKRGRLLISGSANATSAALGAFGNIEVCVVRLTREPAMAWRYQAADAPVPIGPQASDEESEAEKIGVMRAVLEHGEINGQVLTPRLQGAASLYVLADDGPQRLGDIVVGADQTFSAKASHLERLSWQGGRLVLRLRAASGTAEGFVQVASFAEITRRAGASAPRLFALLAGTETPADVAAIMSWFQDDPSRFESPNDISGGSATDGLKPNPEALVLVSGLNAAFTAPHRAAGAGEPGELGWVRFMQQVHAAFREPRGRLSPPRTRVLGEDEDEGGEANPAADLDQDQEARRARDMFESLLELMTTPGRPAATAMMAYDLAHYVCERLAPAPEGARTWLNKVIDAVLRAGVEAERRNEIAGAILIAMGVRDEPGGEVWARTRLQRLQKDFAGLTPEAVANVGFLSVLTSKAPFNELWGRVALARTPSEQAHAYWQKLNGQASDTDFEPWLEKVEEGAMLRVALSDERARRRINFITAMIDVCPRCSILLPTAEASRLRGERVATSKNCCSRIFVCVQEA